MADAKYWYHIAIAMEETMQTVIGESGEVWSSSESAQRADGSPFEVGEDKHRHPASNRLGVWSRSMSQIPSSFLASCAQLAEKCANLYQRNTPLWVQFSGALDESLRPQGERPKPPPPMGLRELSRVLAITCITYKLGAYRLSTRKRRPIIHHKPRANHIRPPVHRPRHKRHLQQTTQLVLVLYTRLGMHESTLVGNRTITPNKDVIGDRLPEYFDFEHVGDDFLGFAVDVGVDEGDVVVARDYVAEG
ncbi:hypothetical protein NMY22_g8394 [Coprinellus aureogranulatus]|nr:hypothetical protein NMY22_g8394 [Coprinellus aureogranulatus]